MLSILIFILIFTFIFQFPNIPTKFHAYEGRQRVQRNPGVRRQWDAPLSSPALWWPEVARRQWDALPRWPPLSYPRRDSGGSTSDDSLSVGKPLASSRLSTGHLNVRLYSDFDDSLSKLRTEGQPGIGFIIMQQLGTGLYVHRLSGRRAFRRAIKGGDCSLSLTGVPLLSKIGQTLCRVKKCTWEHSPEKGGGPSHTLSCSLEGNTGGLMGTVFHQLVVRITSIHKFCLHHFCKEKRIKNASKDVLKMRKKIVKNLCLAWELNPGPHAWKTCALTARPRCLLRICIVKLRPLSTFRRSPIGAKEDHQSNSSARSRDVVVVDRVAKTDKRGKDDSLLELNCNIFCNITRDQIAKLKRPSLHKLEWPDTISSL